MAAEDPWYLQLVSALPSKLMHQLAGLLLGALVSSQGATRVPGKQRLVRLQLPHPPLHGLPLLHVTVNPQLQLTQFFGSGVLLQHRLATD